MMYLEEPDLLIGGIHEGSLVMQFIEVLICNSVDAKTTSLPLVSLPLALSFSYCIEYKISRTQHL